MRMPREAAVFVYKGERFLLMRRPLEGYWHVVAGVVEEGESYAEGAIRELREETGMQPTGRLLDLQRPQAYAISEDLRCRYDYPPGTTEVVIQTFAVEAPSGWEPVLNDEHDDHRWCSLDEAVSLLHWPEARAALGVLAERLKAARGSRAGTD